MKYSRRLLMSTAALLGLGSIAVATLSKGPTTWIVDDDGGPGVDFVDIPAAVMAAQGGDLILVLPGTYGSPTISKKLTLIGDPAGVSLSGVVTILSAPGTVTLATMTLEGLDIRGCGQTVLLDDIQAFDGKVPVLGGLGDYVVNVEDSNDVRFIDSALGGGKSYYHHALRVENSRVELVTSAVDGLDGGTGQCAGFWGIGGYGGNGVEVGGTSRVHSSLTSITGGDGGGASGCTFNGGGDAGSAAVVVAPSVVIVTGGSYTGGNGGSASHSCAIGGDAIEGTGQLRRSGVAWTRGAGGFSYWSPNCGPGTAVAISNTIAAPTDPTLERMGIPVRGFFGGPLTLRVHGDPGAKTRLFLGREPQVVTGRNIEIELLLERVVTIDLGNMPNKGYVDYVLQLGPKLPHTYLFTGRQIIAQASCVYPGGDLRRTNSVPLVLR